MRSQSRDSLYFTLLLLVFTLAIVIMSFDYDYKTRLMPLIVGIPTLCLLIFQVVVQFNPRLQRFFEIDLFHSSSLKKSKKQKPEERGSLLLHAALIFLYFALIFVIGFTLGTVVYLVTFFKTYAHLPWLKAIIVAAIAGALLYFVLSVGLQFNLFEGLLFGGRP